MNKKYLRIGLKQHKFNLRVNLVKKNKGIGSLGI